MFMKKSLQLSINEVVMEHFNEAVNELPEVAHSYLNDRQMKEAGAKRLKSCTAWVWETDNYYVLQSYDTFIACIDKSTDICYDALRMVYGYTSTSSSHIAKFSKSTVYGGYSSAKWGCEKQFTARDV